MRPKTANAATDRQTLLWRRASIALLVGSMCGVAVAIAGPPAGLIALGAIAAAYAGAAAPGVLFAAFVLTAYYKNAVQPFSPVDITLVLAILNVLQLIPLVLDRTPRRISVAGFGLWALFALLVLAGVLWAADQSLALVTAATWWGLVFLAVLVAALRVGSDERYVRQFLWTFFGIGSLTVLLGLTALSSTERLVVLGQNTIQTGRGALLVPLLALTFVVAESGRLRRLLAVLLVPAALVVGLASGSRGPILAFLIVGVLGVVAYLWRARAVSWRQAGAALLVTAATGVVLQVASAELPDLSVQRFLSLANVVEGELSGDLDPSAGDGSVDVRAVLLRVAHSLFEQHPLLGTGTSGFEAHVVRTLPSTEALPYPHNAILQIAAEYGVVGLAISATLVLLALYRPIPPSPSSRALRLLLAFYLINALFSGDIMEDRLTWGLVMLLLMIDPIRWAGAAGQRKLAGAKRSPGLGVVGRRLTGADRVTSVTRKESSPPQHHVRRHWSS